MNPIKINDELRIFDFFFFFNINQEELKFSRALMKLCHMVLFKSRNFFEYI